MSPLMFLVHTIITSTIFIASGVMFYSLFMWLAPHAPDAGSPVDVTSKPAKTSATSIRIKV